MVLSLLCNQTKIKKGIGCHSSLAVLLAMLLGNRAWHLPAIFVQRGCRHRQLRLVRTSFHALQY